jgi:hypothetical protein
VLGALRRSESLWWALGSGTDCAPEGISKSGPKICLEVGDKVIRGVTLVTGFLARDPNRGPRVSATPSGAPLDREPRVVHDMARTAFEVDRICVGANKFSANQYCEDCTSTFPHLSLPPDGPLACGRGGRDHRVKSAEAPRLPGTPSMLKR